jgi:hypothetical protein
MYVSSSIFCRGPFLKQVKLYSGQKGKKSKTKQPKQKQQAQDQGSWSLV